MSATTNTALRRKVVIDTDAGCDDAIAILLALKDPSIDVVAITSVFGNVPQKQATENIYTILRVFDRLDIPFYAGASQPLVVDLAIHTWPGHGTNGLGDASFLEGSSAHHHEEYQAKVQAATQKTHAAQALIDLSLKYPGELDLIALGPLTNLALAVRLGDAGFSQRWKSLAIMGGSCFSKGNASMAGEFNFYSDPEAAYVTLQHFPSEKLPVMIMPWETTETFELMWSEFDQLTAGYEEHVPVGDNKKHKLEASFLKKTHAKYEYVVRKGHKEKLAAEAALKQQQSSASSEGVVLKDDQARALNEITSLHELTPATASGADLPPHDAVKAAKNAVNSSSSTSALAAGVQNYFEDESPTEYICCDSYVVAAYLHPELITESVHHYSEVVINGGVDIRGMLAVDWYDRKTSKAHKSKRVTIVTKIDRSKYLQLMMDCFQPKK